MRFVLYDHETSEPITVLRVPGLTERDLASHSFRYYIPVPPRHPLRIRAEDEEPRYCPAPAVPVWFERFHRNGQLHWMAFTNAAELAMLLDPDWLPGQRPAIAHLEADRDALIGLLGMALGGLR